MALLKATQPQADLSLQALMFRIEQLEARLGGGAPAAEQAPARAPAAPAPPRAPARSASGGGPVAAVAAEPETDAEAAPAPVGAVELDQLQAIWPAVGQAVTQENAMLGAALGAARPVAVEGERLTVAFPPDAAFVKKKAEANRDVVQRVLRGLTGHSLLLAYELRDDALPVGPQLLGEAELIERLRAEFAAEEVFEEEER
jgi:DNA polymerase-3 subunit gamma/tau